MFDARQTRNLADEFDAKKARELAEQKTLEEILSTVRYNADKGEISCEFRHTQFSDTVVQKLRKLGFEVEYKQNVAPYHGYSGTYSTYITW